MASFSTACLRHVACLFGAIALLAVLPTAHSVAAEKIMIQDAWVAEVPPAMKVHAAYLNLMNPGQAPAYLVSIDSPQYAKAELHLSTIVDGVATMAKQEQLTIPAGGTVALRPGGFHVMLMKPKAPLKAGDTVDLAFHFADGTAVAVTAPVRKGGSAMPGMHQHHRMN